MRQFCKRGFSFLMSLCMLFTLVPAGAAETGTAYDAGESCFDFEAANYSVKENEGEISVKILRQGDANAPVNVAVKAADFLAEYGRDYEILLDGEALSAQKGEIVDPSMFTFDPGQPVGETGESATEATQPAAETGEPVAETAQPATETAEAVTETEEPAAETGEPVEKTEEPAAETEEAATETEEPVNETAEASTKVEEPATETEEPAAETGEAATETAEASTKVEEPATETEEPAAETGEAATETEEAVEDTAEAVEEVSLSNDAALAGVQFFETPAVSFETPSVSFDVPTTEGVTEPEAATDAAESVADTGAATDTAEPVADTEAATDAAEPVTDTESVTDAAEPVADTESATDAAETSTEAETPSKVDRKSNSPLLDAQAAYLGVPEDDDNQQMQDALERITKDLHTFFEEAQGAQGIVYFAPGVTERVLTVRVIDNDDADGPRMFLMSLLGTDSEKAAVALNNTVKVTIEDDEAYEPSTFSLYAKDRTLTVDKPTATVKVSRTGGLQYFATAYVSTVTETALSTAYEKMNYREVGFIPGQTEVEVTVTAKEFDGGTFGVRLETNEGDFTREHYLKFTIEAQDATPIGDAPDEDAAELMAGGVTLGAASYFYGDDISTNSLNSFQNFPGGWKSTRSGNAGASVRGGYDSLQRRNYALLDAWADDKGAYGMIVSNQKWNFTGVKNLSFQMSVSGDNWRSGKWSMFGAASNQKWSDYDKAYTEIGDMGITTETVSGVASLKGEHYLKFGTEATLGGKNNPRARLYWFKLDYAKYSFDLQDSPRMFERILYDFSQGTPQISGVYYDGTSQTTMTPGAVKIEARNGNRTQDVGAFYTNAEKAVTITAADGVAQHGFILAGVYFVSDDRSASSMWDGRQYTNRGNYYYVDADSNGKINLTLGASFVETLISKGVLHSEQRDETIRVFPKYEQETAKVHFENTDRPTDSAGNDTGLYDAAHLASHFANIIETYNLDARGQQEDKPYWSGLSHATYTPRDKPPMTYYETTVAKNSVIRVKSVPLGSRTAQGAYWWYFGKENQRTKTYHKAGDRIASANYTGGQPVSETDYTMADIVVTGDLCIKPATNVQTFRVRMFPGARTPETMPSLQNAVVDVSTASADMDVGVNVTNAEGVMDLADPYLGKVYTLQANPPQGYYTFWTRMTGDADEDGTITDAERETLGNVNAKSSNPDYIWGNTATIKLDQNDTRYYYEFLPAVSGNSGRNATGKVIRQNNTLRGLVAREPDFAEPTPIANAYVSAAGQNGRTDADGKYAIPLPGAMPSSGNVSMTLSRDGRTYHSQTRIQASTLFKIPALEEFEPKEVSASYENKGPVSGGGINCEDENVSITVAVTSTGTVIPTKAFFSLYNQQGAERFKLNWYETSATTDQETEPREVFRDGYSVEYRTERVREKTTLYATITFNPRRDTSSGNQIYVTFADQSGVQYSPINVGYTFYTPLTLGEFIFGMIGSPTLENVVTNSGVLDLIGDPLGNTDLGAVTGFASTSYEHYPPNVARENQENSKIQMTSNTFGWASEFSSTGGFDLNKEINENGGSFDSFMDGLDGKNASSAGGFSASGSYGFSITPEIGFRLTTSQRNITEQGNTVTKHCFEDLVFYVKLGFDVSAEATITTPIYVEVLVGGRLSGSMAGIYHMFMQYPDLAEQQGVLPFDSENFGLFKSFPNNPVQREGYIFIDPQLDLKLGVGGCSCYIYGTAIFKFDIDFQFTSARINAYADLAYRMNFGIEAFGIEVYEYETPEILRFKIFNTEGTNAHINFGYEVAQTLNAQLMSAADDDITQTRPVERSYLANRTGWQVSDAVTLLDAEGSVEKELRGGSSDNMQVQMVPINDNDDLLMVFVDDAPARSTGNKRAVYYSVYSASRDSWSTPAIIHDDGTPDDYPTLQNLGDGKILAAWSSAERVMPDDANLETMASAMNIEVAFFDASSRTFGESAVLTKTTEGDFTADIMPRAAYDPATDRIILYYTKTEYSDLKVLSDYGKAESVVAYLFYENGQWSNTGDAYAADELEG
ncbi:MAG: hypothetical protein IJQ81_04395, partial [Oscillibacter sp.]|nr:hypothetical protein [Oscillibacter sp.]